MSGNIKKTVEELYDFFCFYPFNVCEEPTRNQTARLESYSRMRSTSSTVMNANARPHRPKTGEAKNRTSRYLVIQYPAVLVKSLRFKHIKSVPYILFVYLFLDRLTKLEHLSYYSSTHYDKLIILLLLREENKKREFLTKNFSLTIH